MLRYLKILIAFLCLGTGSIHAQLKFKTQFYTGFDLYCWYKNPRSSARECEAGLSSGSALSSVPIGTRLLVGKDNFSISAEAGADLQFFALDVNHFKGLGAVAFPLLLKMNFGAVSGFSKTKLVGWSLGGGIQYQKTELFYLTEDYKDLERKIFPTYIGEIAIGGGVRGFQTSYFVRVGFGKLQATSVNTGFYFFLDLSGPKNQKQATIIEPRSI